MKIVSFDIETVYGPNRFYDKGFYLTCIGFMDNEGNQEVVWFDHVDNQGKDHTASWARVRSIIEGADRLVAHNLKYDMTVLRGYDISFENQELWCTMVTEYLLSGQDKHRRTFNLNACAEYHGLGTKIDKVGLLWDQDVETYDIPKDLLEEYVLHDCELALKLYGTQVSHEEYETISLVHKLQMEFQLSLSDMELYGFCFNANRAMELVAEMDIQREGIEKKLKEIANDPYINIGSSQQRSALLYGGLLKTSHLEWTIKTLKTIPESRYYERTVIKEYEHEGLGFRKPKKVKADGYYPADKDTIKALPARGAVQKLVKSLLIENSVVKKARETLLGKKDKGLVNKVGTDGRIHPNLNMAVTSTGRLSSSDPNSQNMPRGGTSPLKQCIVPFFDYILNADLSQVEWRCAAELSRDSVMIQEINSGIDQHNKACTELMGLELNKDNRNHAKVFNFRMIYGGSAYGYYMDGKMPNFPLKKWEGIVNGFQNKYFGLTDWNEANVARVYANKGELRVKTGRKFCFPQMNYEYNERQIKNYPIQGCSGGDILPICAVVIRRALVKAGFKSRMILTVHDSLVFDVLEAEKDRLVKLIGYVFSHLVDYIKDYYGIDWITDLAGEIEIGTNYGELKEIKI